MAGPTLANRRALRLATLAALYVAQGLPWGFVGSTLVAYLHDRGFELRSIGDLSVLVMLPWTLKFVWGPIIDRFSSWSWGRRRPWIVIAQASLIATLLAMAALGDVGDSLGALTVLLCIHNAFIALQDVSTDSLAIELLPDSERGIANGFMNAGHYVGVLIGGAGLTWLLSRTSLSAVFGVQAAVLGAILLLPLLVRERPPESGSDPEAVRSWRELGRAVARAFSSRSALLGAALALAIFFGQGVLLVAAPGLLFRELGWTEVDYAGLMLYATLAAMAGALAGGALASALGRRAVVAGTTVLLGAAWLGFAAARGAWTDATLITAFSIVTSAVQTAMVTALVGLFMDLSLPRVGASQFVVYTALLNASRTVGTAVAADLVERVGYAGVYVAVGAAQLACAVLLLPLDPRQVRRVE